jgi:hypothetical protein
MGKRRAVSAPVERHRDGERRRRRGRSDWDAVGELGCGRVRGGRPRLAGERRSEGSPGGGVPFPCRAKRGNGNGRWRSGTRGPRRGARCVHARPVAHGSPSSRSLPGRRAQGVLTSAPSTPKRYSALMRFALLSAAPWPPEGAPQTVGSSEGAAPSHGHAALAARYMRRSLGSSRWTIAARSASRRPGARSVSVIRA